ncbi:MAG: hypothetical protein R2812_08200 [Gelidibacter sp.]
MKNILLLCMLAVTLSCCNKNDDQPANPIDQLPPATQTGANTFGCLLDGEVFLPDNLPNSTNCFYQLVNGGYYFTVRATNYQSDLKVISIKTAQLQIAEGLTYNLYEEYISGNAFGNYTFNSNENYTSHTNTGELTITKLDFDNNIVSGTFFFDIEDQNGVVHEIREGRFDMQFTQ